MKHFASGFLCCYFIVAWYWGTILTRMGFPIEKIVVSAVFWPNDFARVARADIRYETHP